MPNGEWAAYDPEFYKKYWQSWQAQYSEQGKGKNGKGWEGVENEDMVSVNAVEELKKSQLAEREKAKGLTAKPATVVAPPPTIATVRCSKSIIPLIVADMLVTLSAKERHSRPIQTSAVHAAARGILEPGGYRGEACGRSSQPERGREQIR